VIDWNLIGAAVIVIAIVILLGVLLNKWIDP